MITTTFQQVLRTGLSASSERVGLFSQAIVYECKTCSGAESRICTLANLHIVLHARAVVEAVAEVHNRSAAFNHLCSTSTVSYTLVRQLVRCLCSAIVKCLLVPQTCLIRAYQTKLAACSG